MLGLLGEARAVGSFFLLGPDLPQRLESPLSSLLGSLSSGRAAASRLPGDVGLFARVLASTSDELRTAQREILTLARDRLFGRGAGHGYKP